MPNTRKTVEETAIVENLMQKLSSSSVPDLLKEAVHEGTKIGMAMIVQRLADSTKDLPALNFTGAPKRDKTPKGTVQCPFPNCTKPGIRPQHNFCAHHAATLEPKKKEALRAKQLEAHKKARAKEREDAIAARRNDVPQPEVTAA